MPSKRHKSGPASPRAERYYQFVGTKDGEHVISVFRMPGELEDQNNDERMA